MTDPAGSRRPSRRVLTYANVVATAALLVAATGAGVAADAAGPRYVVSKIAQVKPGVVKKLRGRAGIPGPAGSAGPAGASGPQGPAGPAGSDATRPVPSGRTISGVFAVAGSTQQVHVIALPMPLPAPISSSDVSFAVDAQSATIDDDPRCAGSYPRPTAPPGVFCVYAHVFTGVSGAVAGSGNEPSLADRAIYLTVASSSPTAAWDGSWAYTAP